MKRLFKQLISVLLAAACFGGMIAAAADVPAVENQVQPGDAAIVDTGNDLLPFGEDASAAENELTLEKFEEQVPARAGEYKYTVTIPAGGTATLPQWHPNLTKGTVVDIEALATTPGYTTFTFSLQSSNGGGFVYGITEGQTKRMTMPNSGEYTITFSSTKAVTALIKITTDPV